VVATVLAELLDLTATIKGLSALPALEDNDPSCCCSCTCCCCLGI